MSFQERGIFHPQWKGGLDDFSKEALRLPGLTDQTCVTNQVLEQD
jgi:hypothetical protein